MSIVIGREKEIEELKRRCGSGRPEFIAVYGRRRVGKTFLINETLGDNMTFHHTGLSPYDRKRKVTLKDQLQNFYFSLIRHGMEGIAQPKSWMEAFFMLEQYLERRDNGSRQVVFIDELPWMDTPRSGFLTALEAFWNGWGNTRHNLCFVVCGSAASWMLDNLINNKGGLYGRLTCEIKLAPFTLLECEKFFVSRGIKMSRYSLAQNIDRLFFNPKAKLGDEFDRLFNSVFDHADACMKIVKALGQRHSGYTREEIAKKVGINPNGDFTSIMKALMASDFVKKYVPYGVSKREEHYKLSDCFCWFWLHFKESHGITETDYWEHHLKEPEIASWRGVAFEEVCFQHIYQIKMALQIAGVSSKESALIVKGSGKKEGMQLDLLIDRADDVVNVCEMKFNKSALTITKANAQKLVSRVSTLEKTNPDKTYHLTLISVMPLKPNAYSDTFTVRITIDELFK